MAVILLKFDLCVRLFTDQSFRKLISNHNYRDFAGICTKYPAKSTYLRCTSEKSIYYIIVLQHYTNANYVYMIAICDKSTIFTEMLIIIIIHRLPQGNF